ncbi:PREDICTED: uncharacterized protein LOC104747797 [Camelina sativa]|uniref:Uncharacterized protein LOC104747797 n=1 Tax=Camelina sativa TaxID=90675 RepID=A0ABM1R0H8_CAMSA|nr:PREDICTED: uncharacterized protein LOC104747797 [Camelina sativa]
MAKWNAIVVIMMVVIVVMAVEAKWSIEEFKRCFRNCSKSCHEHDGNCFERCKIKCGGPNPPGPLHGSSRISHGVAAVELRGREE